MLNLGFEENEAVGFKDHGEKIQFFGIFFFFQKPEFFVTYSNVFLKDVKKGIKQNIVQKCLKGQVF